MGGARPRRRTWRRSAPPSRRAADEAATALRAVSGRRADRLRNILPSLSTARPFFRDRPETRPTGRISKRSFLVGPGLVGAAGRRRMRGRVPAGARRARARRRRARLGGRRGPSVVESGRVDVCRRQFFNGIDPALENAELAGVPQAGPGRHQSGAGCDDGSDGGQRLHVEHYSAARPAPRAPRGSVAGSARVRPARGENWYRIGGACGAGDGGPRVRGGRGSGRSEGQV